MRISSRTVFASVLAGAVAVATVLPAAAADKSTKAPATQFHVPVEYYKLPNGLRVILSQDHTAPTVTIVVVGDKSKIADQLTPYQTVSQ